MSAEEIEGYERSLKTFTPTEIVRIVEARSKAEAKKAEAEARKAEAEAEAKKAEADLYSGLTNKQKYEILLNRQGFVTHILFHAL